MPRSNDKTICGSPVESRFDPDATCTKRAILDGRCHQHHPRLKAEAADRRTLKAYIARRVQLGLYPFWVQVAIVALMQALRKAGREVPMEERRG